MRFFFTGIKVALYVLFMFGVVAAIFGGGVALYEWMLFMELDSKMIQLVAIAFYIAIACGVVASVAEIIDS